jgi:hypothetical protein
MPPSRRISKARTVDLTVNISGERFALDRSPKKRNGAAITMIAAPLF